MNQRNLVEEIWHQLKSGEMTKRLLIINIIVYCFIQILFAISRIFPDLIIIDELVTQCFAMHTNFSKFIIHPWTLFTSIFTHFSIWHIGFNMIFLYFAGSLFEKIFGAKKLLVTYLIGGLLGNIFEILAHVLAPDVLGGNYIVGASGAIMAVFTAIAFYRPQTPIQLFGMISIPIYVLAIFFLVKDILGLGKGDEIAHFAHLGGAFFGYISIKNVESSSNPVNWIIELFRAKKPIQNKFKRSKTDDQFNAERRERQIKTDSILDKIAKSGYESLTREEKDFLFKQSNHGK